MNKWDFNAKEINQTVLEKQGNYNPNFNSIYIMMTVNILMITYGIYSLNTLFIYISFIIIFIIEYFLIFFSSLLENNYIIRKIKTALMNIILFILVSILMRLIIGALFVLKIPFKFFKLKGISYSPENILLLIQIVACWSTFLISMKIEMPSNQMSLFLIIMYAICKIIQEVTIKVCFNEQTRYIQWNFEQDVRKIETLFIQGLVLWKSILVVFPFDNSTLADNLISIIIVKGISDICKYIINTFLIDQNIKNYLLNVMKHLEYIYSKLENFGVIPLEAKIRINPLYIYCNYTTNKKFDEVFQSIDNLCFKDKKDYDPNDPNDDKRKLYKDKESLKNEILNTLNKICSVI